MSQFWINFIFVIGSFIIYTAIAVWARAKSTREFYRFLVVSCGI